MIKLRRKGSKVTSTPITVNQTNSDQSEATINFSGSTSLDIVISNEPSTSKRPRVEIVPERDNHVDVYCINVLLKSDLNISSNEQAHVLTKDQTLIVQSIGTILADGDEAENVQKFMKTFEEYCSHEGRLKKMLQPTKLERSSEMELISGLLQESVVRILLTVDCLQSAVIKYILEKITECILNEDDEANTLRLLLRPLRFLPYVSDVETLGSGILEVTETASGRNQLELVCILPDILPDDQHNMAADILSRFIREDDDIRLAAVDCLNHLNLTADRQNQIRQVMLRAMRSSIPLVHFPPLTQFILADCSADLEVDIVNDLRKALDFIALNKTQENERATSEVLTFSNVRTITMRSRTLPAAWIQMVQAIKWHTEHRPFDIIILILIHSTSTSQKKIVESIFKKRIISGLFKKTLLTTTFTKYLVVEVIKEYLPQILEIASALLQMRAGVLVTDYASAMFTLVFTHAQAKPYQQHRVVTALVSLAGFMSPAAPPLEVLVTLADIAIDKLGNHVGVLLNLLEKFDSFGLDEIARVFDILCKLAFGPGHIVTLRDNLHILIQKQLGGYKRGIKLQGVIGAIMAIKHMIIKYGEDDTQNETEQSFESVADLPEGPARQAASLLETMMLNVQGHVEATGLAYDQLAVILRKSEHFDRNFLVWILDTVTNDFQNTFITEDVPTEIHNIEFTMQHKMNDSQHEECSIAINIGGICFENKLNNENSKMVISAPLFRLMWLLHHKQYGGDLTSINALLGCAIIMPDIDNLNELVPDQARLVLDCYFHCINWLREIISAFVSQKNDANIHKMVLGRLYSLVQLENKLANLLQDMPGDYRPPPSRFPAEIIKQNVPLKVSHPSTSGKGRPKKKANTSANTSALGPSQPTCIVAVEPKVQSKMTKSYFRELDTDILVLLKEPLNVTSETSEDEIGKWSLIELQFVLEDLVGKLKNVMDVSKTKSNSEMDGIHIKHPTYFITDCIKFMPNISENVTILQKYIEDLLESCHGVRDAAGIFLKESIDVNLCFGLLLEYQALTLSWPDLQCPNNMNLLKDGLQGVVAADSHKNLKSVRDLVAKSSEKITGFADICLHLRSAVSLVRLLQAIAVHSPDPAPQKKIAGLCEKLLSFNWYDLMKPEPDHGAEYNINVDILLKGYVNEMELDTLHDMVERLREECLSLKANTDSLRTFPCIRKNNFPLLYRAVCLTLVNSSRARLDITAQPEKHLSSWYTIAVVLQNLVNIVKVHETRTNLFAFFRRSLELFKLFLNRGMTVVEVSIRSRPDDVIKVLRTIQQSTRFVHSLCCHSKTTKDRSLIGLVPSMRLTLEALVYRVKAALVANDCSAAFWMGNLRNKNIHGEEILSQSTEASTATQDEEDLPPDDDDDTLEELGESSEKS